MTNTIDFAAARRRIESLALDASAVHEIEIDARAIPVEIEIDAASLPALVPPTTLLERLTSSMSDNELAELLTITLEESK